MKYSQTNTKPSYIPRKLIGRLTQQSAQSEPQNSAGTWHGEVNWGREKLQRTGNYFCMWREDRDEEENMGKAPPPPPPKAAGEKVEKWKQPQGLN